MISIRRSSVERSPPLASGWCCLTSALYFALTSSSVASAAEAHHLQRLALGVDHLAGFDLGLGALRARPPAAAAVELAEHAERIGGAVEIPRPPLALLGAGVGAHLPGRTMAGQRILLVARDGVGIHALEEIVVLVVFADVIETEVKVLLANSPGPWARGAAPLFWQPAHSHMAAASRACACCFALSLLGLMRMESKNLDELIGMTDFDYAMREASSLDIANTSRSDASLTESGSTERICRHHEHQGHYHKQVA